MVIVYTVFKQKLLLFRHKLLFYTTLKHKFKIFIDTICNHFFFYNYVLLTKKYFNSYIIINNTFFKLIF